MVLLEIQSITSIKINDIQHENKEQPTSSTVTVKVQFRPSRFSKPGRSMNTVFMVGGE
jgi:hypothetical protein